MLPKRSRNVVSKPGSGRRGTNEPTAKGKRKAAAENTEKEVSKTLLWKRELGL
jgi:hypothetical protein